MSFGRWLAPRTAQRTADKNSKTPTLDHFGRDLTAEAREGKLDPAAGREREIRRVLTVLGRRQKNNPVLIGEPGVGKTAIVEGIARRIAEGNVTGEPAQRAHHLAEHGRHGRGRHVPRPIRGAHQGGPGGGPPEPEHHPLHRRAAYRRGRGRRRGRRRRSRLLKPALARGELRCIGATTLDEYRKHIEKDAALERRFQPVMVDEPSVEEAIAMLRSRARQLRAASRREDHRRGHSSAAVTLSDRYINDRFLPDKAIDVMDEAASAAAARGQRARLIGPRPSATWRSEIGRSSRPKKEAAALREDYERAAKLRQRS